MASSLLVADIPNYFFSKQFNKNTSEINELKEVRGVQYCKNNYILRDN